MVKADMAEIRQLEQGEWDAIIVGTGMGGATLGYALAKQGWRILFCEKGCSPWTTDILRGDYAEMYFDDHEAPGKKHSSVLARAGRWHDLIEDRSREKRPYSFIPLVGSGAGGSSALYGMALERFHPSDFTPRRFYPDAQETSLPEEWPIGYDDLRPYYRAAEELYGVRGDLDPLRDGQLDPLLPPSRMSGASMEIFQFLQEQGLHPYRLPQACKMVPGCVGCQGFLCSRDCKNDSGNTCLKPAIQQHGARLLDQSRVISLRANRETVEGVVCEHHGQRLALNARVVVLAAGALETPCILLRSRSNEWPQGLANDSGLVGRNLMRHYVDLFALYPGTRGGLGSGIKELAFNDFYLKNGSKSGTVQSFGTFPPAHALVAEIENDLRNSTRPWLASLFRLVRPMVRQILDRRLPRSVVLASIMEDLPYPDRWVRPAGNGIDIVLEYRSRPEELERIRRFRKTLTGILKPYRLMLIKQAENNKRIAHVCGTCRFGTDPDTSVLDANNRTHNPGNLYIVDSSFFPSSGGTNPSLTIAANALRVADHLQMNK